MTIELDDQKDILTIEKKIMYQIFRSLQKPQGKPVRRSKQNDTNSKTAHPRILCVEEKKNLQKIPPKKNHIKY